MGELLRAATRRLRKSGSETARLDAELLLAHVLRADRVTLMSAPEVRVNSTAAAAFDGFVARRERGEPVAYIRGRKEFYGLVFTVDPRALIPRPETELLVELGLARLRHLLVSQPRPPNAEPLLVWDVGTGSGAIAVALAVECRRRGYADDVRIRATDVSRDALALATENAVVHDVVDRIEFAVANLTAAVDMTDQDGGATDWLDNRPADLLVANLPYIPSGVVPTLPVAASFEPLRALDGGVDGLETIRRLIGELPDALTPSGIALLEIGDGQAAALRDAVSSAHVDWDVAVHPDLVGRERVFEMRRGGG